MSVNTSQRNRLFRDFFKSNYFTPRTSYQQHAPIDPHTWICRTLSRIEADAFLVTPEEIDLVSSSLATSITNALSGREGPSSLFDQIRVSPRLLSCLTTVCSVRKDSAYSSLTSLLCVQRLDSEYIDQCVQCWNDVWQWQASAQLLHILSANLPRLVLHHPKLVEVYVDFLHDNQYIAIHSNSSTDAPTEAFLASLRQSPNSLDVEDTNVSESQPHKQSLAEPSVVCGVAHAPVSDELTNSCLGPPTLPALPVVPSSPAKNSPCVPTSPPSPTSLPFPSSCAPPSPTLSSSTSMSLPALDPDAWCAREGYAVEVFASDSEEEPCAWPVWSDDADEDADEEEGHWVQKEEKMVGYGSLREQAGVRVGQAEAMEARDYKGEVAKTMSVDASVHTAAEETAVESKAEEGRAMTRDKSSDTTACSMVGGCPQPSPSSYTAPSSTSVSTSTSACSTSAYTFTTHLLARLLDRLLPLATHTLGPDQACLAAAHALWRHVRALQTLGNGLVALDSKDAILGTNNASLGSRDDRVRAPMQPQTHRQAHLQTATAPPTHVQRLEKHGKGMKATGKLNYHGDKQGKQPEKMADATAMPATTLEKKVKKDKREAGHGGESRANNDSAEVAEGGGGDGVSASWYGWLHTGTAVQRISNETNAVGKDTRRWDDTGSTTRARTSTDISTGTGTHVDGRNEDAEANVSMLSSAPAYRAVSELAALQRAVVAWAATPATQTYYMSKGNGTPSSASMVSFVEQSVDAHADAGAAAASLTPAAIMLRYSATTQALVAEQWRRWPVLLPLLLELHTQVTEPLCALISYQYQPTHQHEHGHAGAGEDCATMNGKDSSPGICPDIGNNGIPEESTVIPRLRVGLPLTDALRLHASAMCVDANVTTRENAGTDAGTSANVSGDEGKNAEEREHEDASEKGLEGETVCVERRALEWVLWVVEAAVAQLAESPLGNASREMCLGKNTHPLPLFRMKNCGEGENCEGKESEPTVFRAISELLLPTTQKTTEFVEYLSSHFVSSHEAPVSPTSSTSSTTSFPLPGVLFVSPMQCIQHAQAVEYAQADADAVGTQRPNLTQRTSHALRVDNASTTTTSALRSLPPSTLTSTTTATALLHPLAVPSGVLLARMQQWAASPTLHSVLATYAATLRWRVETTRQHNATKTEALSVGTAASIHSSSATPLLSPSSSTSSSFSTLSSFPLSGLTTLLLTYHSLVTLLVLPPDRLLSEPSLSSERLNMLQSLCNERINTVRLLCTQGIAPLLPSIAALLNSLVHANQKKTPRLGNDKTAVSAPVSPAEISPAVRLSYGSCLSLVSSALLTNAALAEDMLALPHCRHAIAYTASTAAQRLARLCYTASTTHCIAESPVNSVLADVDAVVLLGSVLARYEAYIVATETREHASMRVTETVTRPTATSTAAAVGLETGPLVQLDAATGDALDALDDMWGEDLESANTVGVEAEIVQVPLLHVADPASPHGGAAVGAGVVTVCEGINPSHGCLSALNACVRAIDILLAHAAGVKMISVSEKSPASPIPTVSPATALDVITTVRRSFQYVREVKPRVRSDLDEDELAALDKSGTGTSKGVSVNPDEVVDDSAGATTDMSPDMTTFGVTERQVCVTTGFGNVLVYACYLCWRLSTLPTTSMHAEALASLLMRPLPNVLVHGDHANTGKSLQEILSLHQKSVISIANRLSQPFPTSTKFNSPISASAPGEDGMTAAAVTDCKTSVTHTPTAAASTDSAFIPVNGDNIPTNNDNISCSAIPVKNDADCMAQGRLCLLALYRGRVTFTLRSIAVARVARAAAEDKHERENTGNASVNGAKKDEKGGRGGAIKLCFYNKDKKKE